MEGSGSGGLPVRARQRCIARKLRRPSRPAHESKQRDIDNDSAYISKGSSNHGKLLCVRASIASQRRPRPGPPGLQRTQAAVAEAGSIPTIERFTPVVVEFRVLIQRMGWVC